jgi:hypothetical protein
MSKPKKKQTLVEKAESYINTEKLVWCVSAFGDIFQGTISKVNKKPTFPEFYVTFRKFQSSSWVLTSELFFSYPAAVKAAVKVLNKERRLIERAKAATITQLNIESKGHVRDINAYEKQIRKVVVQIQKLKAYKT